MAKFNFVITVHVGNDLDNVMLVASQDFDMNFTMMFDETPILKMAQGYMGFRHWQFDDGVDAPGTSYCQYVSYNEDKNEGYILASWNEIDEKGFIK